MSKIKNEYEEFEDYVLIHTIDCKKDLIVDTMVSKDDFYEKLIDFEVNWFPAWNDDMDDYYIAYSYRYGEVGHKRGKTILLHRFLTGAKLREYVDHKNHNIRDNRKDNLQVISNRENLTNRKGKNKNNKSGYRNVFWNSNANKWEVSLVRNYKRIYCAQFDDVDAAGADAERARRQYYGKYAGLN